MFPQFSFGEEFEMQMTGKDMDGGMGFPSAIKAEGTGSQLYSLTIGIEGATEGLTELGEGIIVVQGKG